MPQLYSPGLNPFVINLPVQQIPGLFNAIILKIMKFTIRFNSKTR